MKEVDIKGKVTLKGNLEIPKGAKGIVLFAHGSGSSRFSKRNQFVANELIKAGMGFLLMDLLTEEEEQVDNVTGELRFDIDMLADRVVEATEWLKDNPETKHLKIGYFGSSTGAGAALVAASKETSISAIVSRGGRPDLAGMALAKVTAPTLLIVGGDDEAVIGMNKEAMEKMKAEVQLEIIPGATHLFEEPGTLEKVAELAAAWFKRYLK